MVRNNLSKRRTKFSKRRNKLSKRRTNYSKRRSKYSKRRNKLYGGTEQEAFTVSRDCKKYSDSIDCNKDIDCFYDFKKTKCKSKNKYFSWVPGVPNYMRSNTVVPRISYNKYVDGFLDAIEEGNVEKVRRLIIKDIKLVNSKHPLSNQYPLQVAATTGNIDIVKDLIKNGADIECADTDGMTPLRIAADHSKSEVVELLLKNGANCDIEDSDGYTPLLSVIYHNKTGFDAENEKIVSGLLEAGANLFKTENIYNFTAFHLAAGNCNENILRVLIKEYIRQGENDLNMKSKGGITPLMLVALSGCAATRVDKIVYSPAVCDLIKAGAKYDGIKDNKGRSVFDYANTGGRVSKYTFGKYLTIGKMMMSKALGTPPNITLKDLEHALLKELLAKI